MQFQTARTFALQGCAEQEHGVAGGSAIALSSRQDLSAATDTRADTRMRNREERVKENHIKNDSSQVVAYLGDFANPAASSAHVQPVSNEHTVARTALELQCEKADVTSGASAGARVLQAATGEAGSADDPASKTAKVAAERAESGSAGGSTADLSPAETSAANGPMPAINRQIDTPGKFTRTEFVRSDDGASRVGAAQEITGLHNQNSLRMAAADSGVEAAAHSDLASTPALTLTSAKAEMPEMQGRIVGGQVSSVGALSGSSLGSATRCA